MCFYKDTTVWCMHTLFSKENVFWEIGPLAMSYKVVVAQLSILWVLIAFYVGNTFFHSLKMTWSQDCFWASVSFDVFFSAMTDQLSQTTDVYIAILNISVFPQSLNCLPSFILCFHIYFFEGNICCLTTYINTASNTILSLAVLGEVNCITFKHFVSQ